MSPTHDLEFTTHPIQPGVEYWKERLETGSTVYLRLTSYPTMLCSIVAVAKLLALHNVHEREARPVPSMCVVTSVWVTSVVKRPETQAPYDSHRKSAAKVQ